MAAAANKPSALPPEYKKRLYQGVVVWVALVVCLCVWVGVNAGATRKALDARVPHIAAQVKTVYLTPQIKDAPSVSFNGGSAAPVPGQGSYVSLIVTDLGLAEDVTKRAIDDMPEAVALAFSPYGDSAGWIGKAQKAKHESLLLLPMEPDTFPKDDPGPKALLTRITDKDNAANLTALLMDGSGAVGMMNFMGSEFLSSRKSLPPVFETLHKTNALFVENPGKKPTAAEAVAAQVGLPYIAVDLVVDSSATEIDVGQRLIDLEKLARQRGYAVGLASPYPVSFNMIKSWAADLEKRGVKLIPLSAMVKVKARVAPQPEQPQNAAPQPAQQ
jgi:polysaccharide deacetylase 2 family uncharacterized protein YibQ